ncbi:MAG: DNA primase [Bacteroidota bacterium]|nr:DNA primase [Bacteroidota bacterium]
MILPQSIEEVLQRADIVEIIEQFIRLKKRGANYVANCPFHNESTPSFSVNPARGIFKCFGCGKGGNAVTFVQEHEKLSFPEAIKWIASYYKIALQETERSPEQQIVQQVEESIRVINEFATTHFQTNLWDTEDGLLIGQSYFKERGFSKEIIEQFRLGYSIQNSEQNDLLKALTLKGFSIEYALKSGVIKQKEDRLYDAYRGRVIFPIQNMTGRVLGFGARILVKNDKAPKYINSPENEIYIKSKVLYGLYQSRTHIAKLDECFLVEGYTDVVSLHQGGVKNVVASSGTSLTEDQLRLIKQLTRNLTILYDGDAAGVKAALRGLDMALAAGFNVKLVLFPDKEDPDSYIQKYGAVVFNDYILKNKKDIIEFRLELGMEEAGRDPIKKTKLVNEIAQSISFINKTSDFVLHDYYVKEAVSKLQIDEASFLQLINSFNQKRQQAKATPAFAAQQERIEQELADVDTNPYDITAQDAESLQELQLIKVLLIYGAMPKEDFLNVADYIYSKIEFETLVSANAQKIYKAYFDYCLEKEHVPELSFFVNHADTSIQKAVTDLLQDKHELSPNWFNTYNIEVIHGAVNYLTEVESVLSYFEMKKVKVILKQITKLMEAEKNPQALKLLLTTYKEHKALEKELLKLMGTVIFKTNN